MKERTSGQRLLVLEHVTLRITNTGRPLRGPVPVLATIVTGTSPDQQCVTHLPLQRIFQQWIGSQNVRLYSFPLIQVELQWAQARRGTEPRRPSKVTVEYSISGMLQGT